MKPVPVVPPTTKDLFSGNPMMAEVGRNLRRISGFHLAAPARKASTISVGVIYTFFLLLIARYHGDPIADVVIILQTVAFCLIVPSVTHNAIVGERERRSWDMLLVAPVTPLQIVVAKYATGLTTMGLTAAALFPAIVIGSIGTEHPVLSILLAEIVSLTFGICLNAFALAASARAKRSLHAQTTIFGTAAGLLLLWPLLVGVLAPSNEVLLQTLNLLNPFGIIAYLFGAFNRMNSPFSLFPGWQIGFYLLATLYFLRSANRNVMRDVERDAE